MNECHINKGDFRNQLDNLSFHRLWLDFYDCSGNERIMQTIINKRSDRTRNRNFHSGTHKPKTTLLDAYSKAVIKAVDLVSPSVVQIMVQRKGSNQNSREPSGGTGSGFIISSEGFIVTNSHVVNHADQIKVNLPDGSVYNAEVRGNDSSTDIAIIRIYGKNFPAVKFGDSKKLRVGQLVVAIGNPFGFQ